MFCRNLLKPGLHSRKIKTYFEQMQTLDSREFIDQGVVEGGIFQFLKKLFIPTHDDDDIYIMVKCLYVCNVFAYFYV